MYQRFFELQEDLLKALANSKRLEIVQLLSGRELSVTEMIKMLDLPQANLSQHLGQLRQAGVVVSRRKSQAIFYRLANDRFVAIHEAIKDVVYDSSALRPEERQQLADPAAVYPIVHDVVCGMRLSLSSVAATTKYNDHEYYFCASGCEAMFNKNPNRYINKIKG